MTKTLPKDDIDQFAQLIVKHATDSMVFTDTKGLTLWANEAFRRMSGYDISELVGKTPGEVLQGKDTDPNTVSKISKAIKAKQTIRTEILNYSKDGTAYWIDITISPVFDDDGRLTHFMSIERDVTDSKALFGKLEETLAEERERKRERRILSQMSEWLFAAQSLEELKAVVARSMAQLFPESQGQLFIYSNSRDVLDRAACWGATSCRSHLQADECWGLRRGRAYSFGTSEIDFACSHVDSEEHPYFCLPIIAHGDTIGLMHINFPELKADRECSEELNELLAPAMEVAQICAEQISLAAANVRWQTELQDRSVKDPLTGLWNRRWFLDMANREVRRAEASGGLLSLAIIDIDHFKRYNDSQGHDAGDAVLKVFSACMSDLNADDVFACRIGGEEFALICNHTDAASAERIIEGLRARLGETQLVHSGEVLPGVTISAGVAQMAPGNDLEMLMKRADEALYAAKDGGRNRTMIADEHGEERFWFEATGT
ncbi:sensor domain-containing diguanylate cyclase [Oricola sp.]|uniref:sensor domain-containing diguanylate cyclase n=1 Tax=Oricola sp. TaxID=1979950 RepID=UPI003BABFFB7